MNELELKTIKLEPAKIEFNKDSILDELNETLKKYENLVFTEDNTTEIRKVLADLRKGKTAADEFRKSKKKEAIAPVTAFEKEVKEVVQKFDNVINPINEQLQEFETERKEKKRVKVEEIIANSVNEFNLEQKYADQLTVLDEYLAKSVTNNRIKEMIDFRAQQLLSEQDKEKSDIEMIETFVKLKNSEHGLNLSVESYLSQLEYKDTGAVKNTIESDSESAVERRDRDLIEQSEKRQKEEQVQKEMETVSEIAFDNVPFEPEIEENLSQNNIIDDLPFGDVSEEVERSIMLAIAATESELNIIKSLLDGQGIYWEVVSNEPI